MNKTIILAICGKSAVGKDYLATGLKKDFKYNDIPYNMLVSDTTRPPREGEINGVAYNFISVEEFCRKIEEGQYIEGVEFRKWLYGVSLDKLKMNCVNIGVFNPGGLRTLQRLDRAIPEITVIPILLEENLGTRLRRSYERENKGKIEYLRRSIADGKDFIRIKKFIQSFRYNICFKNEEGVVNKSRKIVRQLQGGNLTG